MANPNLVSVLCLCIIFFFSIAGGTFSMSPLQPPTQAPPTPYTPGPVSPSYPSPFPCPETPEPPGLVPSSPEPVSPSYPAPPAIPYPSPPTPGPVPAIEPISPSYPAPPAIPYPIPPIPGPVPAFEPISPSYPAPPAIPYPIPPIPGPVPAFEPISPSYPSPRAIPCLSPPTPGPVPSCLEPAPSPSYPAPPAIPYPNPPASTPPPSYPAPPTIPYPSPPMPTPPSPEPTPSPSHLAPPPAIPYPIPPTPATPSPSYPAPPAIPYPSPPTPAPAPPPSSGIKGAYWPSWLAYSHPPPTIPTTYFTHLFYAFVQLSDVDYQLVITQPDDQWMRIFTSTLHSKNPPAKAFLSIGSGSSNSSTFSNMANNKSNRANFIGSTIEVARKYGFDGLDLDWEFPQTEQDMTNLGTLFAEWSKALHEESYLNGNPKLQLSAAVYFASNFFLSDVPRTYPAKAIREYVDFINPMCFDYHGSWDTSVTGAHAAWYDPTSNINTNYGIKSWIDSGVPAEKLVMGLPLYGRTWELKDPEVNGIGAPAVGVGPGTAGRMTYSEVVEFNKGNVTIKYDSQTVSIYSYAGTSWVGYDGPLSMFIKLKYAQRYGIGGYFFWALGYDNDWSLTILASKAWDKKGFR